MRKTWLATLALTGFLASGVGAAGTASGVLDFLWMRTDNGLIAFGLVGSGKWYVLSHNSSTTPLVVAQVLAARISGAGVHVDWGTETGNERTLLKIRAD